MLAPRACVMPIRFGIRVGGRILVFLALISHSAGSASHPAFSYFPATEFSDLASADERVPEAWANYLSSMGEVGLFKDHSLKFAVRVTVAPSYREGKMIRIYESKDGVVTGVEKQMVQGTTHSTTSRFSVTPHDLDAIKKALIAERFWQHGNNQEVIAETGQSWLLEVKIKDDFHVLYSDGPSNGPVLSVGQIVLDIANRESPVMQENRN